MADSFLFQIGLLYFKSPFYLREEIRATLGRRPRNVVG
jgi:hypothetical protein